MNNQKQHTKTLQVILWLWFGTITSFVSVNVVNIARLETKNSLFEQQLENHEERILSLKNNCPHNLNKNYVSHY